MASESLQRSEGPTNGEGDSAGFGVQAGAKAGVATISPKTINKKLSNLSNFLSWLNDQGYVDDNPFSGLTVKDIAARRKRDPFSPQQLQVLFRNGVEGGEAVLSLNSSVRFGPGALKRSTRCLTIDTKCPFIRFLPIQRRQAPPQKAFAGREERIKMALSIGGS